jgi:hypothetical protein
MYLSLESVFYIHHFLFLSSFTTRRLIGEKRRLLHPQTSSTHPSSKMENGQMASASHTMIGTSHHREEELPFNAVEVVVGLWCEPLPWWMALCPRSASLLWRRAAVLRLLLLPRLLLPRLLLRLPRLLRRQCCCAAVKAAAKAATAAKAAAASKAAAAAAAKAAAKAAAAAGGGGGCCSAAAAAVEAAAAAAAA